MKKVSNHTLLLWRVLSITNSHVRYRKWLTHRTQEKKKGVRIFFFSQVNCEHSFMKRHITAVIGKCDIVRETYPAARTISNNAGPFQTQQKRQAAPLGGAWPRRKLQVVQVEVRHANTDSVWAHPLTLLPPAAASFSARGWKWFSGQFSVKHDCRGKESWHSSPCSEDSQVKHCSGSQFWPLGTDIYIYIFLSIYLLFSHQQFTDSVQFTSRHSFLTTLPPLSHPH